MIKVDREAVFMQGTAVVLMSEMGMAMSELIGGLEAEGVSREAILKVLHKNVDAAAEAIDAAKEQQEESEAFNEEELKRIFKDAVNEMIGR